MPKATDLIVALIAMGGGLIVGMVAAAETLYPEAVREGVQMMRIEAVKRNYAEWVTDTAGNSTFRWIERNDESEAEDAE